MSPTFVRFAARTPSAYRIPPCTDR